MEETPDESYRHSTRWDTELLPRTKHDVRGLQWLHGNLFISIKPITMSRWKRSADNTKRSSKPSQHPTRSQPAYAIILRANPPSLLLRFPFPVFCEINRTLNQGNATAFSVALTEDPWKGHLCVPETWIFNWPSQFHWPHTVQNTQQLRQHPYSVLTEYSRGQMHHENYPCKLIYIRVQLY